jgi:hypothetical protein
MLDVSVPTIVHNHIKVWPIVSQNTVNHVAKTTGLFLLTWGMTAVHQYLFYGKCLNSIEDLNKSIKGSPAEMIQILRQQTYCASDSIIDRVGSIGIAAGIVVGSEIKKNIPKYLETLWKFRTTHFP